MEPTVVCRFRSGGVKKRGHGREKGFLALEESSMVKTVVQN
jgi:aldehyde dehydrogenase (NAD+)